MDSKSIEVGSRFIASTMHEIRTPLQTIIGTLELLSETPLNPEQTEYIHQVEFSANALLGLANDILDFTKITADNFKLENSPFDVIELTERVVDLISVEAFANGLEVITDIDYSLPHSIMGDAVRVQQIILNLVKNATKFTEKGFILVRVSKREKQIVFEIIDSGIGVPQDKHELIFKDFYQIDGSSARKNGGTGLGLSISKNLVQLMKGKIGVLPNPSGGSNFWFTIPLEIAEYDENTEENQPVLIPEGTKVLISSVSPLFIKSFRTKLAYFGLTNVDVVSSLSEASEKIEEMSTSGKSYEMTFIDISTMNTKKDYAIAQKIKNNPFCSHMYSVLLIPEGKINSGLRDQIKTSFNSFLYRPIKHNALKSMIEEQFSRKPASTSLSENNLDKSTQIKLDSILNAQIASTLSIIVAEDQPVNKKILETFLKKFGATVHLAENGEKAVEQIKAHPETDIVFMDIFMPIKSGIDATIEARNLGYKGIIIACTANNDADDFKMYKQIGMNDILIKPFKKNEVKEILEKWNSFLIVPNAKDIISLSYVKDLSSEIWDLEDFMETTENNTEFAISLMDEYIEQAEILLNNLKNELVKESPDFQKLELYSHTLKGSSASVSATRFANLGKQMNDAAKIRDKVKLEAARINFAIDFIDFKNIIEKWKISI